MNAPFVVVFFVLPVHFKFELIKDLKKSRLRCYNCGSHRKSCATVVPTQTRPLHAVTISRRPPGNECCISEQINNNEKSFSRNFILATIMAFILTAHFAKVRTIHSELKFRHS